MDNGKISVRYARALLGISLEQHCEKEVYDGMVRLTHNYGLAIGQFNEALSNPTVSADDKLSLLSTAVGEPLHPCLLHFLRFVIEKKRENKIYLIGLKYEEMYRKHKGILMAKVTTATTVDDTTLAQINDYLKDTFHRDIEMHFRVDPSLIGGFTLDIEHERMDASVAGRLEALKKQLKTEN